MSEWNTVLSATFFKNPAMVTDDFKERNRLREELLNLAARYVVLHKMDESSGFSALGEDLLRLADCTEKTSWIALIMRLQKLSG